MEALFDSIVVGVDFRLCRVLYLYGGTVMTRKREWNYRHVLCIAVTLCFLACSVFVFPSAFYRVVESLRDFALSIAYYVTETFGFEDAVQVTVNGLPKGDTTQGVLPGTYSEFKVAWKAYWKLWADKDNFLGYLMLLGVIIVSVAQVLTIVPLFIVMCKLCFNRYLRKENNDYGKESKTLQGFKKVVRHTYAPVKKWCVSFWHFLLEKKAYLWAWIAIWAYNFNVITICLEFLAYYFYFAISFKFGTMYRQFYKLFLDLSVPFRVIPIWLWCVIGLIVFDKIRKSIAYSRLRHFERKNRGFINARPIVYMVCGTMGKKKTTTITDMALSQEIMFRDKAFEKILENDMKFPHFPWIRLENALKREMGRHSVYNLATARKYVRHLASCFYAAEAKPSQRRTIRRHLRKRYGLDYENLCFGYDYERYGLEYDDDLKLTGLWETLETYAQLYFIYVIESSLLISNYSVRVDCILSDLGNFPLWNADFFKRDARLSESYSRHAHILDFDSLRLGRRVVEDNAAANNFEFGVVVITEVGKERGNTLELSEKKKKDETANQKNDLFNSWLKMVRHSATVDNFPFVRVITDEQRPESWGADARDLCEIVTIKESGEMRLTMPGFSLFELVYGWAFSRFSSLYYEYRYARGDDTLPIYLIKGIVSKMQRRYVSIYNRFGYCKLQVQIESGTQDGTFETNKYYLMSKKIYSKRFSTDCFSDFFTAKTLRSPIGIDDLAEYGSEKATFGELAAQNSYFVGDLLNGLKKDKD